MASTSVRRVCVYLGSAPGRDPAYASAARATGEALALRGVELVYGGAHVGCMGAVADGAVAAGGRVTGVIPRVLLDKELAHSGLTELHEVESMHERKLKMAELADAFLALPGGLGTLEEVFEMLTWCQLGLHSKPVCFVNIAGYFDHLIAFLDHAVAEGFMRPSSRALCLVAPDAAAAIDLVIAAAAHGIDTSTLWRPPQDVPNERLTSTAQT